MIHLIRTRISALAIYFLFLLSHHFSSCYVIMKNELRDLDVNDISRFGYDITQWTSSSLTPTGIIKNYSTCDNINMLGGYDILVNDNTVGAYFQRTYTDLPIHTVMHYSFEFWMLDYWEPTDQPIFYFDSIPFNAFQIDTNLYFNDLTYRCGGPTRNDTGKIKVMGSVPHSLSTLTFKVASKLNDTSIIKSFAIRNINFMFGINTTLSASLMCGIGSFDLPNYECECVEGFYKPSAVGCSTCHPNCMSCYGPSEKHCLQCNDGYSFDGYSCNFCGALCTDCEQRGGILENGVCMECTSFSIEYIKGIGPQHYYQLKMSPRTCDMSGSLLAQLMKKEMRVDEYFPHYEWNINKTARNTYEFSLLLLGSVVQPSNIDFSIKYLKGIIPVKKQFVADSYTKKLTEVTPLIQIILLSVLGASLLGTLGLGDTSPVWSVVSYMQFVAYLTYINVDYPLHVEGVFSLFNFLNWNTFPNPFKSLSESTVIEILLSNPDDVEALMPPRKFLLHGDTSFFFENAGMIVVVNGVLLMLLFISWICKKAGLVEKSIAIKYFRSWLRWNVVARITFLNGITLALAIFLQFSAFNFDNGYLIACGLFAIFSSLGLGVFPVFFIRFLHKHPCSYLEKERVRGVVGTLYEGMALRKPAGKYYHFAIFFRGILLAILVVFFEKLPLLQIVPLIYYNAGLIFYLIAKASFKNIFQQIVNILKELLILGCEICVVCFHSKVRVPSYFEITGWVMVGFMGLALCLEYIYLILVQLIGIMTIVRSAIKSFRVIQLWFTKGLNGPSRKLRLRNNDLKDKGEKADMLSPKDEMSLQEKND